jgi:hypothetical protein
LDAGLGKFVLKVETANSRKSDVEYDTAWNVGKVALHQPLSRVKQRNLEANRLQEALQCLPHGAVVVDYKDDWLFSDTK